MFSLNCLDARAEFLEEKKLHKTERTDGMFIFNILRSHNCGKKIFINIRFRLYGKIQNYNHDST